jgi:hypothetical protein
VPLADDVPEWIAALAPNYPLAEEPHEPDAYAFREPAEGEKAGPTFTDFKFWEEIDIADLPALDFVYSDFYARGYTSVSLAAPKVGKSLLAMAEAIDMATGRGILSGVRKAPLKVLYFNAEDDKATLDKRAAALCELYGIPQSELVGQLMLVSGVDHSDFVMVSGQDPIINEPLFVGLEGLIKGEALDVTLFDPLQDLSHSPETNEVFRRLGQRLRMMASRCNIALGLVHHTRKVMAGQTPTMDDMRGGSSLRGTARFNRLLVGMTEGEANLACVPNHHHFFRLGDIESNLAPPSAQVNRWFEKVSVTIANGESIGAVRRWEFPDLMAGVSTQDARRVQMAVAGMAENPPRRDVQSPDWAGWVIAKTLGLDGDHNDKAFKSRLGAMLATWIDSDVLAVEDRKTGPKGKSFKFVVAGSNNPVDVARFD